MKKSSSFLSRLVAELVHRDGIRCRFLAGGRTALLVPLFAIAHAFACACAGAQEASVILERSERAYDDVESLRADFYQRIEVPLLDRMREGHGIWLQKGPTRFKMDFRDPAGDVVVADGEHVWMYYPSRRPEQVIRSDILDGEPGSSTANFQSKILDEIRDDFDAIYEGTSGSGASTAHVIVLTPKDESRYRRVRLWIDPVTFLIERYEFTELTETIRVIELTNIELGVEIDDREFDFAIPPGTRVFAR